MGQLPQSILFTAVRNLCSLPLQGAVRPLAGGPDSGPPHPGWAGRWGLVGEVGQEVPPAEGKIAMRVNDQEAIGTRISGVSSMTLGGGIRHRRHRPLSGYEDARRVAPRGS